MTKTAEESRVDVVAAGYATQ